MPFKELKTHALHRASHSRILITTQLPLMPFGELEPNALHRASHSRILITTKLPLMPFRELEPHVLHRASHRPNIYHIYTKEVIENRHQTYDKVSSFRSTQKINALDMGNLNEESMQNKSNNSYRA